MPERSMTRRWYALLLLSALGASMAGCGDEEVSRLPPSALSTKTPPTSELDLVEALPKPAHFGAGWTLETDSLGGDDYFLGLATGWFPEQCAWADTEKAGLEAVESAYAASAEYDSDEVDISPVTAEIAVDSPAKAERRFAYLRRIFEKCTSLTYRWDGKDVTRKLQVLPDPKLNADDTLRVRFEDQGRTPDFTGEQWCARVEGVVLCLAGEHVPEQTLSAAFAWARQTLDT
ncbi:hypothetical protein [Streptomyces sp. NPDC000618]|uniref:hypothetical protein n=1 Tax=Streptomyces sp. NPDC000618 TaxID=3154265 RepID=UPI0033297409